MFAFADIFYSSARLKSLESFRSDFSRAKEAAEIQAGFVEIVISLIKFHVYKLACLVDKRSCLNVTVFCFHRGPRLLTVYTNWRFDSSFYYYLL